MSIHCKLSCAVPLLDFYFLGIDTQYFCALEVCAARMAWHASHQLKLPRFLGKDMGNCPAASRFIYTPGSLKTVAEYFCVIFK